MIYKYGIIFWNEKTDDEVRTYVYSGSWYHANSWQEKYTKTNYKKGPCFFIEREDHSSYTIRIEDFCDTIDGIKVL